jgi:hypothetical protein
LRLILVSKAYRLLERKLQETVVERDAALHARDDVLRLHEQTAAERDAALRDRDVAVHHHQKSVTERDTAIQDRDAAARLVEQTIAERDAAVHARDNAGRLFQATAVERDIALRDRGDAIHLQQEAIAERDTAVRDRDAAVQLRQETVAERDAAIRDRDAATYLHHETVAERDTALRARDDAIRLYQDTIAERDSAIQNREDAIRLRDEVLEREARRSTRHFVFCHIPRTGGSSVWHALAECAAKTGVPILDLYWLSMSQYSSTGFAYNVLSDHAGILSRQSTLIHLHTFDNISYFLSEKEVIYTTIVRDPIDRFCSDVAHLHNALLKFSESAREEFFASVPWSPDLKSLMIDDAASLDALLELAARESFFRFFYFHFFFAVLCAKPLPIKEFEPPNEHAIKYLAGRIKERFAYIGRYPDVAESFHNIAECFGLPHDRDRPFTQHINRTDVNKSVQHSRERFAGAFQCSYQLLAAVGQTF